MRRMILCLPAAFLLGSLGAAAQMPTPRAEREPSAGAVREAERAAGVAPSAAEQARDARTEDQLYRELTGQNPNTPPPPGPLPGLRQGPQTPAVEQIYRELTPPAPR
ncbi:hypothetical protein Rmf_24050 [Roseomonas fluvialis]|uniref:DUF4148 domain-containing protein n=2 Tax=Roseomonas fluvialis TaxID=1750527 RepID=A0ABM7Y3T2_9PROT|nr:hypothetical protein Rmf_24050 [Roseomonas fluvialis]